MASPPSGVGMRKVSSDWLLMISAKIRKFAAPRGMSICPASFIGLPVSNISARRNSSRRLSIKSATLWSRPARLSISIFDQGPVSAERAELTAWSMSSALPSRILKLREPFAGLMFSKVWRPIGEMYCPLIKKGNGFCFRIDMRVIYELRIKLTYKPIPRLLPGISSMCFRL